MYVALCDDDQEFLRQLEDRLLDHNWRSGPARIKTFLTGEDLWYDYQSRQSPFDAIILDIEMPGANGIEVAKRIRERGDSVPIVLLTAYEKYALDGYEVRPYHYLLKPVGEAKLGNVLQSIEQELAAKWRECLCYTTVKGMLRIPFASILYMESRNHHVLIHTTDEIIQLYRSLSELAARCDARFLRPHQSFLVNVDRVRHIRSEARFATLVMDNGDQVPVSQKRKEGFFMSVSDYDCQYGRNRR